jgi:hypothetical protein
LAPITAIYADVEKESPRKLRVNRLLVLKGNGDSVLIGGPFWYAIDTSNEMLLKFTLLLTASGGERDVIMGTSPNAVIVGDRGGLEEVLRRYSPIGAPAPPS